MSVRDRIELVLLGAIWGSSFLFMRVAAPEFGPLALIEVRVAVAALFLSAVLASRGALASLRGHAFDFALVGALNSAIPFSLFAFATLSLPAGYSSVLNATVPLFGALVGFVWLGERLAVARVLGLAIGFGGVVLLVFEKLTLAGDRTAVAAGLAAAVLYAIAAHVTRRRLAAVRPLAIAAGSQIAASVLLAPFALATAPKTWPSASSAACAVVLGVLCTGLAYVLYFRLLAAVGAARSMTVTYLIPLFGLLWGALFLAEPVHPSMLVGGVVILIGVTLVVRGGTRAPTLPPPQKPGPCRNSPTRTAP
ncbi:MAG: DMT family transporter [Planctomycetes bacterium]|nr:DMT family transporter [Planctomycetota bacterium]